MPQESPLRRSWRETVTGALGVPLVEARVQAPRVPPGYLGLGLDIHIARVHERHGQVEQQGTQYEEQEGEGQEQLPLLFPLPQRWGGRRRRVRLGPGPNRRLCVGVYLEVGSMSLAEQRPGDGVY